MGGKKALLLGASGVTGGQMLKQLLEDDAYVQVTVYGRKAFPKEHPKLVKKIINLKRVDEVVEADDVFCCLDNNVKKAGGKKAFQEIALDYPLKVAKLQKNAGSTKFIVVSTMGADKNASGFYNQIMGKLEEGLKTIGFPSLFIFRPSIISGKEKEKRTATKVKMMFFKTFDPLLLGPFKKFRLVSAKLIAVAMLHYANSNETGTQIILPDAIRSFALIPSNH